MYTLLNTARSMFIWTRYALWSCVFLWGVVYPVYARGEAQDSDIVHGGVHWKCMTERGAIHIWAPFHYRRERAGVVVFVHGYSVDVDEAWSSLSLGEQFQMSQRNAVFIVPEAPREHGEPVTWPVLSELRRAIRQCGLYLPLGPWVIVGHSGAYRTIQGWVDDRQVKHLILLDALYARHKRFKSFLDRPNTKMTLVSTETSETSRKFSEESTYTVRRSEIPAHFRSFTSRERRSRLLYLKSQYHHWGLVTNKRVIPLMLRLTRLRPLSLTPP